MFHAASAGKLFTAVLIGRLVEEGRIRRDDRASGILPPEDGTAIVVSLCSDRHMADSVRLLIAALGELRRIRT